MQLSSRSRKKNNSKHIVTAYFAVLPKEADKFYAEQMAYQEEAQKRQEELYDKVRQYVLKMKKSEAQQALLQLVYEGPEWQYERFIRENELDNW